MSAKKHNLLSYTGDGVVCDTRNIYTRTAKSLDHLLVAGTSERYSRVYSTQNTAHTHSSIIPNFCRIGQIHEMFVAAPAPKPKPPPHCTVIAPQLRLVCVCLRRVCGARLVCALTTRGRRANRRRPVHRTRARTRCSRGRPHYIFRQTVIWLASTISGSGARSTSVRAFACIFTQTHPR